jgi:Tol biopolymer transport system component
MPYQFNPFTGKLDSVGAGETVVATANIRANVSPSESPDGTRTVFTVPETYISGTLAVFLNGLHETYVSETTSTTFTFEDAPHTGDVITLNYAVTA